MDKELTDREIVRGLIEGERTAWTALCQRYSGRLWRFVARLVGSDEEVVADVFQETMLAVAKSGRRLKLEDTTLWAWLARIGHNQSALHWRRAYRRPMTTENLSETPDDQIDAFERSETVSGVRALLAEMQPDYVALLTAKYLDDLTIAELVGLLGGTVEGVRSKLARARHDFRERYQRLDGQRQVV